MSVPNIVILGLGNILCGDDAFGVQTAEKLSREYAFPANVRIVDGGTLGSALYTYIEEADILLVLDAADFGKPPGSLIRSDGALPAWLGLQKLSAHQNSFAELLALADLKNTLPQTIVLFGFQPLNIEFGAKLSQAGRKAVAQTVPACLEFLRGLGIPSRKVEDGESLVGPEVLGGGFVE